MKFFNKLRPFDLAIIGILVVCLLVALVTFTGRRATSSKQEKATTQIEIDVFFRGVTATSSNSLFKEGDETFITIRNVPYTKLKIKKVSFESKKTIIPANNQQGYKVIEDVTMPFQYDFLVTVVDTAKLTDDGAVVGGNKIKIGLPVILEGLDYRLNGVVANITKLESEEAKPFTQEEIDNILNEQTKSETQPVEKEAVKE